MRSRDFAFWLQGLFEMQPDLKTFDERQVAVLRQHLGLVFEHDPEFSAPAHPVIPSTAPAAPATWPLGTPIKTFPYLGTSGEPLPGKLRTDRS